LNNTVHAYVLRIKGAVYVAMFKPLSIVIAVAMGVVFLGDTLHLGRYNCNLLQGILSLPFLSFLYYDL
jgi:hypothetical protein